MNQIAKRLSMIALELEQSSKPDLAAALDQVSDKLGRIGSKILNDGELLSLSKAALKNSTLERIINPEDIVKWLKEGSCDIDTVKDVFLRGRGLKDFIKSEIDRLDMMSIWALDMEHGAKEWFKDYLKDGR